MRSVRRCLRLSRRPGENAARAPLQSGEQTVVLRLDPLPMATRSGRTIAIAQAGGKTDGELSLPSRCAGIVHSAPAREPHFSLWGRAATEIGTSGTRRRHISLG